MSSYVSVTCAARLPSLIISAFTAHLPLINLLISLGYSFHLSTMFLSYLCVCVCGQARVYLLRGRLVKQVGVSGVETRLPLHLPCRGAGPQPTSPHFDQNIFGFTVKWPQGSDSLPHASCVAIWLCICYLVIRQGQLKFPLFIEKGFKSYQWMILEIFTGGNNRVSWDDR